MFQAFNKIPRLSREILITEKLDGTNAQIWIVDKGQTEGEVYEWMCETKDWIYRLNDLFMFVGSRNKWITPGKQTDNYGFARWAQENAAELLKLGEGRHFGEWYSAWV